MFKYFGSAGISIRKEDLTFDEFKKSLSSLCDEDFNGDSGEQYVEDKKGNRTSLFEYYLNKEINKEEFENARISDLIKIAKNILEKNYSISPYCDYSVYGYETMDSLAINVSYMYYV